MKTLEELMELSYDEVFDLVRFGWVDGDVFVAYLSKLEENAFNDGVSNPYSGV